MNLKNYDAQTEFKQLIKDFVFPLLGMRDNNVQHVSKVPNSCKSLVFYSNGKIYFYPFKDPKFGCYVDTVSNYNNFDFRLCEKVIANLVKVSYNDFKANTKKQFRYINYHQCLASYKAAVQNAICMYLTGKDNTKHNEQNCNLTLLTLLEKLESWSLKTYEGKKVPFGFIINLSEKAEDKINYLTFLDEEFSATITDGISSIIELDEEGNYLDYKSVFMDSVIKECELTNCLPIRFTQIIKENLKEGSKKIGVFLLGGGDIFIAKDEKIELIKRNDKWANFSYISFVNAMRKYKKLNNVTDELLKEIFSTAIDVSLSHCGGIIAVVEDGNNLRVINNECDEKQINSTESILSDCDNLLIDISTDELKSKMKKFGEKEASIAKRIMKRKIINKLIGKHKYFGDINRKLRNELVGLDGATIIQKDGRIVSFGAIIQSKKGSSGGGRGAAAKTLSQYQGLSVKISTDGYIEVYIKSELKYYIK